MSHRFRPMSQALVLLLVTAGSALLGTTTASAAPPTNDDFANAEAIPLVTGDPFTIRYGTLIDATFEAAEPDHTPMSENVPGSIWYSVTPVMDGNLTAWSGGSDPALAVYTGSTLTSLTQVAQNDDETPGRGSSRVDSFPVSAGTTYWVAVTAKAWDAFEWVAFRLSATPLNDKLSNPAPLAPGRSSTTFNVNAGTEPGETELWETAWGARPHATLWWRFSPGRNGVLDVSAVGTEQNLRLAVFSATPGSASFSTMEPVMLSGGGTAPNLAAVTLKGTKDYYVAAAGATADDHGQVQLSAQWAPSPYPDNDDFADATVIANPDVAGWNGAIGDSRGATTEAGEPDHAPGIATGGSTWFTFVAPATGMVEASLSSSTFDSIVTLYRGTSLGGLTRVGADRGATATPVRATRVRAAVTLGETYYVAVVGADGTGGRIDLWLRFGLRPVVTSTESKRGSTVTPTWEVIRGAHLDAYDLTVWFGTTKARYVDTNDPYNPGAVVVRVPPGLPRGPLRITVSTWAGTAASRPRYVAGVPYILSLSEKVVPRRGGTWLEVRGRDFNGTASVRVGGVPALRFRVLRPTLMRVLLPRHSPGLVRVRVRDRWDGVGVSPMTLRYR